LSPACVIQNIQTCFEPYVESQKEVIAYEDHKKSMEIEIHKQLEEMMHW